MRRIIDNRWCVVVGCFIALMANNGVISNFTFSVFLKPITEELGWGRATITSAMFLAGVIAAFVTPVVGKLMDIFGVRRVALPGIVIYACIFASFSLLQPSLLMLYTIAGTAALAGHVQTPMGYSKAVASRFEDYRGIALGIAVSGVGLGTAVMPRIAQVLIDHVGWRLAFVGMGITVLIFALPMIALFLGEPKRTPGQVVVPPVGPDTMIIVKTDKRFYLLMLIFLFTAVAINGTITHIVAEMTDRGYTPAVATTVLSSAGIALIVGRLASGYCLDRFSGPAVATVFFLIAASGIALIASGVGGLPVAFAGTILCGLGLGADGDLLPYFISRYFGLKSFGTMYGFMIGIFSLGNGLGPFLMGLSYDNTHSYMTAAIGFEVLLLICCGLALSLGAYTFPAQRRGAAPSTLAEAQS
jgi:predicted MFS family arabinose efflux permease